MSRGPSAGAPAGAALAALSALDPEVDAVAEGLAGWLEAELGGPFADLRDVEVADDDATWDRALAWERHLGAAGWRGVAWPTRVGGRGSSPAVEVAFEVAHARAGGPLRPSVQGERLLGPTLLAHGDARQRARFLPPILRSEEIWAQGFSEPGAGSDLAAVRTRARRDAGGWVLDGQKTWTTRAHRADWIYVLARTDPAGERHRGLGILLVPLDQPGVEVRPLRTLAGVVDLGEVFLDGARTEADLVVGEPGDGWRVAMGLLQVERGVTMLGHQLALERRLGALLAVLAADDGSGPAARAVRARLARLWGDLHVLRTLVFDQAVAAAAGRDLGVGPSLAKVLANRVERDLGDVALAVAGPAGLAGPAAAAWSRPRLDACAASIYGGSDEVQRNVVAERGLGLPR